jgi:hypothetical protein
MTRTQDLSHETGQKSPSPLLVKLRRSVYKLNILSIYTKNVRADREFTHLLAKKRGNSTVLFRYRVSPVS